MSFTKAEDTKLKRAVALKFLAAHLLKDEEARKRFDREAQAAPPSITRTSVLFTRSAMLTAGRSWRWPSSRAKASISGSREDRSRFLKPSATAVSP